MTKAMGAPVAERYSDAYFEVVRAGMGMPGWKPRDDVAPEPRDALWHRPAPENLLSDDELRSIQAPVLFVMGDADVYGPPAVVERAAALMPDARVEVLPGGHAPFLDDPARCASLVVSESYTPMSSFQTSGRSAMKPPSRSSHSCESRSTTSTPLAQPLDPALEGPRLADHHARDRRTGGPARCSTSTARAW